MPARPATVGVDYFKSSVNLTASSAIINQDLFQNYEPAAGYVNDLDSSGILPDNRSGQITKLMMYYHMQSAQNSPSEAKLEAADFRDVIVKLKIQLFINNVLVARGYFNNYPHPPIWQQGGISEATASDGNYLHVSNGGYMLAEISHDIGARQSIRVNVSSQAAVTLSAAGGADIEAVIQVANRKSVM